jgi:hypothetical protein
MEYKVITDKSIVIYKKNSIIVTSSQVDVPNYLIKNHVMPSAGSEIGKSI